MLQSRDKRSQYTLQSLGRRHRPRNLLRVIRCVAQVAHAERTIPQWSYPTFNVPAVVMSQLTKTKTEISAAKVQFFLVLAIAYD